MLIFFSCAEHMIQYSVLVSGERDEIITTGYAKQCNRIIQPESKWDSLTEMSQQFLKFLLDL